MRSAVLVLVACATPMTPAQQPLEPTRAKPLDAGIELVGVAAGAATVRICEIEEGMPTFGAAVTSALVARARERRLIGIDHRPCSWLDETIMQGCDGDASTCAQDIARQLGADLVVFGVLEGTELTVQSVAAGSGATLVWTGAVTQDEASLREAARAALEAVVR